MACGLPANPPQPALSVGDATTLGMLLALFTLVSPTPSRNNLKRKRFILACSVGGFWSIVVGQLSSRGQEGVAEAGSQEIG